ncbi:hypothetical protein BDZ89DRAFT_959830 [Hymenopellis radicata]|nr:hypothetical protein BDZ89DRAFT_959830 [Hymenopellis radicata]
MKELAEQVNRSARLHNDTDSQYVLKHLSTSRQKMEDRGYIGVPNGTILKTMVARMRQRKQVTTLNWVKGHNGHEGNEMADLLAESGALQEEETEINMNIPPTLRVTGARLSTLSQKLAYQAFREKANDNLPRRARTETNMANTQTEAKAAFGQAPPRESIWKSFGHKDIDRSTRYFLWMAMHDAYRVGSQWLHFRQEYHERAFCKHCPGEVESLDHILTKCKSPGQAEVWELAKHVLEDRMIPWREPSIAAILSSPMPVFKDWDDKRETGKERLYRIIMTSSAQVIWNSRCERIIEYGNAEFTANQIKNRWKKKINRRLELDCLMTRKRFGKKAIPKKHVINTWKGSLKDEYDLPEDWTEVSGVLVGTAT